MPLDTRHFEPIIKLKCRTLLKKRDIRREAHHKRKQQKYCRSNDFRGLPNPSPMAWFWPRTPGGKSVVNNLLTRRPSPESTGIFWHFHAKMAKSGWFIRSGGGRTLGQKIYTPPQHVQTCLKIFFFNFNVFSWERGLRRRRLHFGDERHSIQSQMTTTG